jgi:hypothetical protein
MEPNRAPSTFRAIAFLVVVMTLGAALFWHGFFGWREGAIYVPGKNQPSFIATPSGDTAASFYSHTFGFMGVGGLLVLMALWMSWSAFFSSSPKRPQVFALLASPIRRHGTDLPWWLFWVVVLAFIVLLLWAARL